jgi:branched-chain amino acid transport system ATP-binding protein
MVADEILLETRRLTKAFGGLVAVNNINLKVKKGEVRAIIGPNGAGKTTLFNLIMGRMLPNDGKIIFNGEDVTGLPSHIIARKGIATTFQITNIFPNLTVFENVWIGAQTKKKLNPFIHFSHLTDVEDRVEEILKSIGLNDKSNEIAANLSHGDQRILEIGIALSTNPLLLLLDEPTSGMSARERADIIKLLKELSEEKTIMLIEHNIDVVMELADVVTVMNEGSIFAEGKPKEISENEKVQEIYLGGR